MALPDCAVETKALQLASGTGVSPCRAENAALVLDAVPVVHDSPPQSTACVASKTRDRNTPLGEYGLMRCQSEDEASAAIKETHDLLGITGSTSSGRWGDATLSGK